MSANRSIGGLDGVDHLCLKVKKVIASEARNILYYIWNLGCKRDLTVSFEQHAKNVLKWTDRFYEKTFYDSMKTMINDNPKGDRFDVSLLAVCIRNTCNKFSQEDNKNFIKPIITLRNNVYHNDIIKDEITMNKEIDRMRDLLVIALNKAKEVYSVSQDDIDDMIDCMNKSIEMIKLSPVPVPDVVEYKKMVKEHRKSLENMVEERGVKSLKLFFKDVSNVDPASWISGKERLDIEMVYIRLEMILKTKDSNSSISVGHENLLSLKTEAGEVPTIILIEGEAGSGKSTLAKYILCEWSKIDGPSHPPSITGLEEYDLVLYVQCKNRSVSNFIALLTTLMPQASYEMTDSDFQRSVLAKRTLVVIDGLDEMNENSEKLVTEMLDSCLKMSTNKLQFIITTRPQKMKIVPSLFGKNSQVHIKIKGIPQERRVDFVQKLHDEMVKASLSKEDTGLLIDYMKGSQCRIGEHYRLPLNLTLLTYLWANDPKCVNSVTSATQLYVAVLELIKCRIISRISPLSSNFNKDSLERLLNVLFEVFLETHKLGLLELNDACYKKLEDECHNQNLSFDEMCGAFFVVDNDWSSSYGSEKFHLSAPHKSIMEFFAANHIFSCLVKNDGKELEKALKDLEKKFPGEVLTYTVEDKASKSLRDVLEKLINDGKELKPSILPPYQNTFIHLSGLLALRDKDALHAFGGELVDVLEQSEIEGSQWLDLLAEAECDAELSSLIAERISKKLVVRDGHTLAAIAIFEDLATNTPVQVILENEVKYIPELDKLMEKLSERNCTVELLLKNHWKNPENGLSTEYLKKLYNKSCRVIRFTGNLDDAKILPIDLEDVRLTIANDSQAETICDGIADLDKELSLSYIGVHVMKQVSPSLLKPLPVVKPVKRESGTIWISGISDDDIDNASKIIKALHPPKMKFQSIMFPRCGLSMKGFTALLEKLKEDEVQVSKNIKTDSQVLTMTEVPLLRKNCKDFIGNCTFYREDEWSVW